VPSLASLPRDALVLLIGPAGSGKSTFAARHFPRTAVVSSDAFREMVADDPDDQSATVDAFRILHAVVRARLRRGRFTVVDATNVQTVARRELRAIAQRFGRPVVAIVFDRPLDVTLAWNAGRGDRVVPVETVRHHHQLLAGSMQALAGEGYAAILFASELAA
jgi:predicted kinase